MKKAAISVVLTILISAICCFNVSASESNSVDLQVVCSNDGIVVTAVTDFITAGISGSLVAVGSGIQIANPQLASNISAYNTNADSFDITSNGILNFALVGNVLEGGTQGEWFTAELNNINDTGELELSLDGCVAADANGRALALTLPDTVSVTLEWIAGDANGDSVVDIRDSVRAKKMAAGFDENAVKYLCNTDFNDNGVIDAADIAEIDKILLR